MSARHILLNEEGSRLNNADRRREKIIEKKKRMNENKNEFIDRCVCM